MDKRIIPIFFITFVNSVGFSIVIPIAPFIVEEFGGGPFMYGLTLSAYSICQYIAAPFLGSFSDKLGRKRLLLLSQIGTILSWCILALSIHSPMYKIFGITLPLFLLITARIVDGLTGGDVSIANAYVADVTKPEERTKTYGYVSAVYGLGFMMGPLLGSYSSNFGLGYMGTVIVALIISFTTLYTILFHLSEPKKIVRYDQNNKSYKDEFKKSFTYLFSIVKYDGSEKVKYLLKERAVVAFIFTLFTSIFGYYLKDQFDMTSTGIGYMFLIVGLFQVIHQGLFVPWLSDKLGDEKLIGFALYIIMFSSILIPIFVALRIFIIILFFVVLGFAIHFAVLKPLLLKNTDERNHGEIVGIEDSIIALNQAFVPIFASLAYEHVGRMVFSLSSLPLIIFMGYFYFKGYYCNGRGCRT